MEINNKHNISPTTTRLHLKLKTPPKVRQRNSKLIFASLLLALGLLVTGIGGAFAPWIWRPSVALQLTGPGLAEFVKFLPEIRLGQIEIERLYFLLPLFVAMLFLPLFACNKALVLPAWLRWSLRLTVIPLALASLSPVWTPAILMATEFRLQTILAGVAVGLAVVGPLFKWLSLKILVWLLILGGLAAISLSYWQFNLIQASISEVYHQPIWLGWGWWLAVGGVVLSAVGGMWLVILQRKPIKDGQ